MTEPEASLGGSAASTLKILEAAKARIVGGWSKGTGGLSSECPCAAVAISRAAGTEEDAEDAYRLLAKASGARRRYLEDDLELIMRWNDAARRTKAQVLAAFGKAIAVSRRISEDASKTQKSIP